MRHGVGLADAGSRVLLVSTDPASNLDEVLGTTLGTRPTAIPGAFRISALNLDPEAAARAYRERVVGPYRDALPPAAVRSMRSSSPAPAPSRSPLSRSSRGCSAIRRRRRSSTTSCSTRRRPAVLEGIAEIQRFLERQPGVGRTLSIADFVARMNQAMHGDDLAEHRIPPSRELVAQYLLLYSMSGSPTDLDSWMDGTQQSAVVPVFLHTDSTASVERIIRAVQAYAPTRLGDKAALRIGGGTAQAAALNEVIVEGKIRNIVQIALAVLVVSAIAFRSLWGGLLVLVPLTLAVIANFGLMGLAGIPLNIATATISAMAVGIGADYAIYLLFRIREEIAKGAPSGEAVRHAIETAGKAILFVASAVAGGYAVLLFSWGFWVHIHYALLIGAAMLVSRPPP
jgi:predicted RND superfamily exporter protein